MKKVYLKLMALNLVLLLLLSLAPVAFAQAGLSEGDNSVTAGEYTFKTIFGGYYRFEGVPVTLKDGEGQTLKALDEDVFDLQMNSTYTVQCAEEGTLKVYKLKCNTNHINQSAWCMMSPAANKADLLLFDESGSLPQMAFKDDYGRVKAIFFYARQGITYYQINKEYAERDYESSRIISTSINCVTLKEGVKDDFVGGDDGLIAIFTPEKTGEYVWSISPDPYSGVIFDEQMNVLAGEPLVSAKQQNFTTLLQAGKTYYYASIVQPRDITVKNIWEDSLSVFKDIKAKDWFVKNGAIDYALNTGLFKGITPTTFEPNTSVTRGMFVTVLGRLHGVKEVKAKTQFADVKKSAYYSGFVDWAAENGIVTGTSPTAFAPDASVTREQICAMMYRYCDFADIELKKINKAVAFSDAAEISGYAKKAVAACQRGAIVNGKGAGKFDPKGQATRAEVATILMNFCLNYK